MSQRQAGYTTRKFREPLDDVLDRPIAFNPAFKRITGSTVAALMLSQAWYWSKRTSDEDGWFYKTVEEWEDETGLSRSEQETARKHLKPYMETDLRNVPARLYYRLDKEAIAISLGVQFAGMSQTSLPEPINQGGDILANINSNTENTTENTTARPQKTTFKGDPTWDILHSKMPTEEGLELARREETYTKVADRLSSGLRRGEFPQTIEAQKVYRWIAEREAKGQNLDRFIAWAMEGRRAEFSFIYHKDVILIKRDWPQVFTDNNQPAAKPDPDGGHRV